MKLQIEPTRQFQPITVTFTLETLDELREVVQQLGATTGAVTYRLYDRLSDILHYIHMEQA